MSDESKQWLGYHENPTFTKSTEGWSMTNEQESAGEFLRRVGTDGYKWSQEMAERFNLPQADLLGWCCNMIEVGRSAGEQAARANSGWLPIESADKEQIEQILLYNGEYYVGGWANDKIGIGSEYLGYTGEGWYTDDWRKIENPTLWKPITPPKTGE